jgi:hypothetical protein
MARSDRPGDETIMDECSIHGLLVYYRHIIENREPRIVPEGYLAGVTFRRTDLRSTGAEPFPRLNVAGADFVEAENAANTYVRENGWWDSTFDPSWMLVREPRDPSPYTTLPPIEGSSMGVLLAIAKAKLAVGWGCRHSSNDAPIHRCDLSGIAVTGTLDVAGGTARNPAIGRVEELASKLGTLLQHASSLAIHVLIVSSRQDGLESDALKNYVEGSVNEAEFYYRSANPHTPEHRILVIRARDVNDAIVRLSEAQGRNVYLI